jgi:hypothetical protein
MKAWSRLLFSSFSIAGIAVGFTVPAHATLQFTVGIPGTETSFTCVDNSACDTNSLEGCQGYGKRRPELHAFFDFSRRP